MPGKGLVKKIIRLKTGRSRTYWVKPGQALPAVNAGATHDGRTKRTPLAKALSGGRTIRTGPAHKHPADASKTRKEKEIQLTSKDYKTVKPGEKVKAGKPEPAGSKTRREQYHELSGRDIKVVKDESSGKTSRQGSNPLAAAHGKQMAKSAAVERKNIDDAGKAHEQQQEAIKAKITQEVKDKPGLLKRFHNALKSLAGGAKAVGHVTNEAAAKATTPVKQAGHAAVNAIKDAHSKAKATLKKMKQAHEDWKTVSHARYNPTTRKVENIKY